MPYGSTVPFVGIYSKAVILCGQGTTNISITWMLMRNSEF